MKLNKTLAALAAASLLFAACSSDEDSTETDNQDETTTTEESTTTAGHSGSDTTETTDAAPAEQATVEFTTDGIEPISFLVTECVNPGESTIQLKGESAEGTTIDIDATDQVGGITIDGPEGSYEGSIDAVVVGDLGNLTVSGQASIADDSETEGPQDFELTGQCA